jgi:hypothetical protein
MNSLSHKEEISKTIMSRYLDIPQSYKLVAHWNHQMKYNLSRHVMAQVHYTRDHVIDIPIHTTSNIRSIPSMVRSYHRLQQNMKTIEHSRHACRVNLGFYPVDG